MYKKVSALFSNHQQVPTAAACTNRAQLGQARRIRRQRGSDLPRRLIRTRYEGQKRSDQQSRWEVLFYDTVAHTLLTLVVHSYAQQVIKGSLSCLQQTRPEFLRYA